MFTKKKLMTDGMIMYGTQIDKLVGANPEEMRKRIGAYVETIHVMAVVLASDGDKFRRGSWFLWFIVSQIM